MILQSLYEYYNKMIANPNSSMPKEGFSSEKISFALEIDKEGNLQNIVDVRKDNKFIMMNVPATNGRSGTGCLPNTLWDNTKYALGILKSERKGEKEEFLYDISKKHFESFKSHHTALLEEYKLPELEILCKFLNSWEPSKMENFTPPIEFLDSNLVFRLCGDFCYLHEYLSFMPLVKNISTKTDKELEEKSKKKSIQNNEFSCIITGKTGKIALTHPKIKGVCNAQPAGASLVSFTPSAFTSYNKKQNENAPISKQAAVGYVSALNYLLDRSNKRNILIGDTNYIFWSEKPSDTEELLYRLFSFQSTEEESVTVEDSNTNKQLFSLLNAIRKGESITKSLELLDEEDRNTRYYLLGLSANNARIVQRYWQVSSLADLAKHIDSFYDAFAIEKQFDNQDKNPRPQSILLETAFNRETKNISPTFPEALIKTILSSYRFPESIYVKLLERIRIDSLNYIRAGSIKAYLTRNYSNTIGAISMSLDKERKDIAYLLGRLFSIIEKTQKDALGGQINATVKDKFLGTACTNPNLVFPQLLKNVQNHIKKSDYGYMSEKAISDLMQDITDFPKTLSLQEQGLFFIGYYHQNNANYKKSENTTDDTNLTSN